MKKAIIFRNLWGYDAVNMIPENCPNNVDCIYITDNEIYYKKH